MNRQYFRARANVAAALIALGILSQAFDSAIDTLGSHIQMTSVIATIEQHGKIEVDIELSLGVDHRLFCNANWLQTGCEISRTSLR